ncbi:MAG TPA: dockerin type I domain-containing protein [Pirellulales bacterium]|jgi:hypothetical protein
MANVGNLYLHFIDGGRGDNDLAKNNEIRAIGGPAIQLNGTSLPPGDLTHDGIVNMQDLAVVSSRWLQTGANNPGDVNSDGIVNAQDIALISSNWLKTTTSSAGAQSLVSVQSPSVIEVKPVATVNASTIVAATANSITQPSAVPSAGPTTNNDIAAGPTSISSTAITVRDSWNVPSVSKGAKTVLGAAPAIAPVPDSAASAITTHAQAVDRLASSLGGLIALDEPAAIEDMPSTPGEDGDFDWLNVAGCRGRNRRPW